MPETAAKTVAWYVQPADGELTNAVILRSFNLDPEAYKGELVCWDNKPRHLWECQYRHIEQLEKAEPTMQLQFNVFRQIGNGKIRPWEFGKKAKRATRRKNWREMATGGGVTD